MLSFYSKALCTVVFIELIKLVIDYHTPKKVLSCGCLFRQQAKARQNTHSVGYTLFVHRISFQAIADMADKPQVFVDI